MKSRLRSSFQNSATLIFLLAVVAMTLISCTRKNTVTDKENSNKDTVIVATNVNPTDQTVMDTIKKPKDNIKKDNIKKDKVIEAPKHNAPEQAEIDSIKKAKAKAKYK